MYTSLLCKDTTSRIYFNLITGVYVGLQGACMYDVVGLKHIAQGYMITSIAYGLTSLITVSTAGELLVLFTCHVFIM